MDGAVDLGAGGFGAGDVVDLGAKIEKIKEWLGEGSVNIFGLPMSGKDTQGVQLAEAIGGKFLSSGMIIREMEKTMEGPGMTANGELLPTNLFYEWVLPYFERRDLWGKALILSSIGRWSGEEMEVMRVAEGAGHPLKVVVFLDLPEAEILARWEAAKLLGDRGGRADDLDPEVFRRRIGEFQEKTVPVLRHYNELEMLVKIDGMGSRDEVFSRMVEGIFGFIEGS